MSNDVDDNCCYEAQLCALKGKRKYSIISRDKGWKIPKK